MYRLSNGKMLKMSDSDDEKKPKIVIPIYDKNGLLLADNQDICDCPSADCPGCFFPCDKCGSTKCGHMCRMSRSWRYSKWANQTLTTNSTSNDPNKYTEENIDMVTMDDLEKQQPANLNPASQPINDFENVGMKTESGKNVWENADVKMESSETINSEIDEMQKNDKKSVNPVQETKDNLDLNYIENDLIKTFMQRQHEIINADNKTLLRELLKGKKLTVVEKSENELIIKKEYIPMEITEGDGEKKLEQTENEKIKNIFNHEKLPIDKESMKECKMENIEQTVLLPQTNNEELKINELKEVQKIATSNVKETLEQIKNTNTNNIENNEVTASKEFENTIIEETVSHTQTKHFENIASEKNVNKLIDIEENQLTKTVEGDIKSKLTDSEQIENEKIEKSPEKTTSHDKQTNNEYVENMETEEIRSENNEEAFNQTVNTGITNVDILIDTEKHQQTQSIEGDIKSELTDMEQTENENIERTSEKKTSHDKQTNNEYVENMETEEIRSENNEEAFNQTVNTGIINVDKLIDTEKNQQTQFMDGDIKNKLTDSEQIENEKIEKSPEKTTSHDKQTNNEYVENMETEEIRSENNEEVFNQIVNTGITNVDKLIDIEENQQNQSVEEDIKNKLTDMEQTENENIERTLDKTTSHDKQTNNEYVESMEIEEIRSENNEEAFNQTVNTGNTNVDKLIDTEKNQQTQSVEGDIKSELTDMEQTENENIEKTSEKTTSHDKQTNKEYVENIETNKIKSENNEEAFNQTVSTRITDVDKLIDIEKNQQSQSMDGDTKNKLTGLEQIENKYIENASEKTSPKKQTNEEYIENVVSNKLIEVDEIKRENVDETYNQTVNTRITNVDNLIDTEKNQQTQSMDGDIKNKLTDLEQIENKNIENASEKTTSPKKQTHEDYIENVVSNKLIEVDEIKRENVDETINRTISTGISNVNKLIDTEKNQQNKTIEGDTKNKLTDMEQTENENIEKILEKTTSHDN